MLVILATHPVQYQVPLWQALARDGRVPFEVWYLTDHGTRVSHDPQFGRSFAWDIDTRDGYPHRFLEAPPDMSPSSFWGCRLPPGFASRLRDSGATALWIQGWHVMAYWQAARHASAQSIEVWLRGESNDLRKESAARRALKSVVLGWLFSKVGAFLCIGSANRRLYQRHGIPETRLHWAPYAVDNARFASQAAKLRPMRAELRLAWGIADDAFCVLFCGKFIPKKRPLDLVRACQSMPELPRGRHFHLLFVGSGELHDALAAASNVVLDVDRSPSPEPRSGHRNERPRATFAGFLNQSEISKAYVTADCLVLPSDFGETWGLVVNEAMASGLPCIASNACGCAEDLIAPGRPVRSFQLADVAALREALIDVLECGAHQGDSARVEEFSLGTTVQHVVDLYRSRIQPRGARSTT